MTLTFQRPTKQAYSNTLLYGPAKAGKTLAAASSPPGILYLNADLPNATRLVHRKYPDGRVREVVFEGMDTLIDIYQAVTEQPEDGRIIETVVVDPIGELHRRLMEEASNRAIRPSINIYGDVTVHLERFCRSMCEAPVNFVIVAHEVATKDEEKETFERLPWTGTSNPALGAKIMGMVDIIGYCGVMETEDQGRVYAAQLVQQGGRRGGDRFDVLGDWRPLDLTEWSEAIRAGEAADVSIQAAPAPTEAASRENDQPEAKTPPTRTRAARPRKEKDS